MHRISNRLAAIATVLAAVAALAGLGIRGLYVDAPNWVQQARGTNLGALFGMTWLGQIATVTSTGVLPPDLIKAGISSNPVYALDLAFFLPFCVLAGIGLVRRKGAAAFAFPMLVWIALMGAGVVGGFFLMAAAGDQIAMPIMVAISCLSFASSGLAALALARSGPVTGTAGSGERRVQGRMPGSDTTASA